MELKVVFLLCACVALAVGESALYIRDGAVSEQKLGLNDVGDMLCHVSQVDPLHPSTARSHFGHNHPEQPPSANLLVVLEGVADELVQSMRSSVEFASAEGVRRIQIDTREVQSDAVAQLATMMTGERASVHGIPASEWKESRRQGSETVSAFSSNGQLLCASYADVIAQQGKYNLKPLVVAVSAEGQLAEALSPRKDFAAEFGNSLAYGWDEESDAFWSRSGSAHSGALLTRDEIEAKAAALQLPRHSVSFSEGLLQVSTEVSGRTLTAAFDLAVSRDFLFLAELLALESLPSVVRQYSSLNERSVDLLAVAVSSLKSLRGDQQAVALTMLDTALAAVRQSLAEAYPGPVVSEVVALPLPAPRPRLSARQVFDNSTNTTYTAQQVADYQTALWSSVFLIVALVMMVFTFYNMDVGADSILYRTSTSRPAGM